MKRLFFAVVAVLIVLFLAAVALLVGSGMRDKIGNADVALVLGNKVNPDRTPSARLKARLDTAVTYFKERRFPRIIVSGGTGKEGVPEGDAMRDYLVAQGVPSEAMLVDNLGVDSYASARNTAAILRGKPGKSVFVVTQYFHVPRSVLALQKVGLGPIYHAHPSFFEGRDLYSIVRELPAYVKYLLRPSETAAN